MIHGSTVNVGFIDSIKVEYHGQKMPISQLGSAVPDRSSISITVFDTSIVTAIVKQLQLEGLSAYASKSQIRVTVPNACEETRDRNKKRVRQLAEEARISMRQVRQEFRKKLQKVAVSKDELALGEKEVQSQLESWSSQVDRYADAKVEYL